MTSVVKRTIWIFAAISGIYATAVLAYDRLPADSKPLEEIVGSLEKSGYAIVEASVDNGRWEIEAIQNDVGYELNVDPATGKILSTHKERTGPTPGTNELPLSEVLKKLDSKAYTSSSLVSAEFQHGQWEIEAYREGAKHELAIDAKSGEIFYDRVDD